METVLDAAKKTVPPNIEQLRVQEKIMRNFMGM